MQLPSSISTRLQYQHKSLIEIIDDLSDDEIRRVVIPGKWSIFENIVHLETYQHTFIHRVRKIMEGNRPVFTVYKAESDPLFLDHCHKSSREVIQDLMSTRKDIASSMIIFVESELERRGVHPTYGEMTLSAWLNFFLLHESHHLFTIFKLAGLIKAAKSAAGIGQAS